MKTMKKRILNIIVLACASTWMISQLNAKVIAFGKTEFFIDLISKDLSVVMFYDKWEDRDLEKMFSDVSDNPKFKGTNVLFISVDVAESSELKNLASNYRITSFPAFMLFDEGMVQWDAKGKVVILYGVVSERKLEAFIDKHIGEKIEPL